MEKEAPFNKNFCLDLTSGSSKGDEALVDSVFPTCCLTEFQQPTSKNNALSNINENFTIQDIKNYF